MMILTDACTRITTRGVVVALVAIAALHASCVPYDEMNTGNLTGYRGVLSTDGRDLGQHHLEEKGTFGTTVNGEVGKCIRTGDGKSLKLDVAFDTWHRTGELTIDRTPKEEGVDVDFEWSHHFIPRSDCSRFEVDVGEDATQSPAAGSLKLTCQQPGKNGDSLIVDLELKGC